MGGAGVRIPAWWMMSVLLTLMVVVSHATATPAAGGDDYAVRCARGMSGRKGPAPFCVDPLINNLVFGTNSVSQSMHGFNFNIRDTYSRCTDVYVELNDADGNAELFISPPGIYVAEIDSFSAASRRSTPQDAMLMRASDPSWTTGRWNIGAYCDPETCFGSLQQAFYGIMASRRDAPTSISQPVLTVNIGQLWQQDLCLPTSCEDVTVTWSHLNGTAPIVSLTPSISTLHGVDKRAAWILPQGTTTVTSASLQASASLPGGVWVTVECPGDADQNCVSTLSVSKASVTCASALPRPTHYTLSSPGGDRVSDTATSSSLLLYELDVAVCDDVELVIEDAADPDNIELIVSAASSAAVSTSLPGPASWRGVGGLSIQASDQGHAPGTWSIGIRAVTGSEAFTLYVNTTQHASEARLLFNATLENPQHFTICIDPAQNPLLDASIVRAGAAEPEVLLSNRRVDDPARDLAWRLPDYFVDRSVGEELASISDTPAVWYGVVHCASELACSGPSIANISLTLKPGDVSEGVKPIRPIDEVPDHTLRNTLAILGGTIAVAAIGVAVYRMQNQASRSAPSSATSVSAAKAQSAGGGGGGGRSGGPGPTKFTRLPSTPMTPVAVSEPAVSPARPMVGEQQADVAAAAPAELVKPGDGVGADDPSVGQDLHVAAAEPAIVQDDQEAEAEQPAHHPTV